MAGSGARAILRAGGRPRVPASPAKVSGAAKCEKKNYSIYSPARRSATHSRTCTPAGRARRHPLHRQMMGGLAARAAACAWHARTAAPRQLPQPGSVHSMHSMRSMHAVVLYSRSVHSMRSLNQAPWQASGAVAVVPLDPTAACAGCTGQWHSSVAMSGAHAAPRRCQASKRYRRCRPDRRTRRTAARAWPAAAAGRGGGRAVSHRRVGRGPTGSGSPPAEQR